MASYEKRGKRSYRLRVDIGFDANGKRLQRMKTIRIEDEALLRAPKRLEKYLEEELLKFKLEVEGKDYIKPEKMSFAQFVEEWREKHAEKELSPRTVEIYMYHIRNRLLPVLGARRMDEIKPMHIVSLLNDMRRPDARIDGKGPISDRTIAYIYAVMRHLFNIAVDWKLIEENPMAGIKKPKYERKKAQFYNSEEVEQVIQALQSEPSMWRIFVLGAMIGGLRRGELLALEWPDVLFDDGAIHVRKSIPLKREGQIFEKGTKNEEERVVEMPLWYMEELKLYRREWIAEKLKVGELWRGGDREYLFHAGFGEPLYFTHPTAWWNDFVKRHNLRKIRLHDLRHTSATLLIEMGVPLKAIQERLGHKQHQTTSDIYSHVTKKLSREAANKFDKFDPKNMAGQ